MMMLGKSRGVAAVLAAALAVAVVSPEAHAQTPAGSTPPATKPADKPAAPAKPQTPAKPDAAKADAAKPDAAKPAATKPADAKATFASGEKKFKAGDFAGALADFEASNAAKPAPETQRYIALCHDNLNHASDAVAAYEKLIAENPAKMKDQVDEAKKRVEAIKATPGHVHVETTPPGAQITVDAAATPDAKPNPQPTPTDLDLAPGKHTLRLAAEGFETADKEIDVAYASKQDLKVELVKKEPPPPPPPPPVAEAPKPAPAPPPPPPEPRSKVPAYVTGAVAIVAAGVGTGFGIKALSQSSDFDKNPTAKKADDGENNALVADMMFGVAITFGVTSAVLFLSSDAPASAKNAAPTTTAAAPKKKSVTVIPTPYVTPNGGGAGALVRF